MILVVDHQLCHSTVNTDILSGYKACFIRAKKEHYIGDVHRIPHTAGRLLQCIRPLIGAVCCIDPARRDGVYPHFPRKTCCHSMGQSGDAALSSRVALRLRLANPVTTATLRGSQGFSISAPGIVIFIYRPLSSSSGYFGIVSHIPCALSAAVTARQTASNRSSGLHRYSFDFSHNPDNDLPGRYLSRIFTCYMKPVKSFLRVKTTRPRSLANVFFAIPFCIYILQQTFNTIFRPLFKLSNSVYHIIRIESYGSAFIGLQ